MKPLVPLARPVISVDIGRLCGCALVAPMQGPVGRPRLIDAWVWTASTPQLWVDRALVALTRADELAQEHGGDPVVVVENPPPWDRGRKKKLDTWLGLGRWQGLLQAAWVLGLAKSSVPTLVRQPWWVKKLGVPWKKDGEGGHRYNEAVLHLENAQEVLLGIKARGRVDAAEAALLGAAVSRYGEELGL